MSDRMAVDSKENGGRGLGVANTDSYLKSLAIKRRALGPLFWGRKRVKRWYIWVEEMTAWSPTVRRNTIKGRD